MIDTKDTAAKQFNPSEHLMKLKNKDYLPVAWRIAWFRSVCPNGIIETDLIKLDIERGFALYKATVHNGDGGQASAHGSETSKDFVDYIEKAETKAIGRALAALGYGTQFSELDDEAAPLADAPVQRSTPTPAPRAATQPQPRPASQQAPDTDAPASGSALHDMIGRAKKRALALDVARNGEEWQDLLKLLKLDAVKSPADIGKITEYLNRVEETKKAGVDIP